MQVRLYFLFEVKHCYNISHFSDGVGRSGTFLCVHSQLERLKTEGIVDVFQTVKLARRQREHLMPKEVRGG